MSAGRHRMPWLERMPLAFVPLMIIGLPLSPALLAAGIYMLIHYVIR